MRTGGSRRSSFLFRIFATDDSAFILHRRENYGRVSFTRKQDADAALLHTNGDKDLRFVRRCDGFGRSRSSSNSSRSLSLSPLGKQMPSDGIATAAGKFYLDMMKSSH